MRKLMDYLPELYQASREVTAFQEAWQPEMDLVWRARDELLAQLDPNTATWGLSYWEDALGLATDEELSYTLRRCRVIARLRGMGTTTLERLQTVLETFCPGCEVSVVEHYSQYLVEIRLVIADQGVEDPDGLKAMLRLIMPAHLAWGFAIRLESSGSLTFGAAAELRGDMDIWPLVVRGIETRGGVTHGAGSEQGRNMEVWPSVARAIQSTGGVTHGAGTERGRRLEVWPLLAREIETAGAMAGTGIPHYHTALEIFPEGGMTNG